MNDIENAYRILELTVGASFKEVAEAREELLILWDTERLAHNPRLRSRSAGKIQQINQAYETLMEHLGRTEVGRGSRPAAAPAPTQARVRAKPIAGSEATGLEQPSTSLFEEVFSGDKSPPSRRIPVWLIVVLVTTAALAIGYVAQSTRGEKQQNNQTADPDPLPKPLESFGSDADTSVEMLTGSPGDPDRLNTASPGSGESQSGESQSPEPQEPTALSPKERLATKPASSPPKPSPPPVSAPKVRSKKQRSAAKATTPKSGRPVLVRQKTDPDPSEPAAQPEEDAAAEKQRREETERAYQLLLSESAVAKKLVAGEFPQRFAEWKVIKQEPPEIWIDIIANEAGGELVHFIWSVNLKTEAIRSLSEAARNPGKGK